MNNILVIGGSGFLGGRLIDLLADANNNIAATYFSNKITQNYINPIGYINII